MGLAGLAEQKLQGRSFKCWERARFGTGKNKKREHGKDQATDPPQKKGRRPRDSQIPFYQLKRISKEKGERAGV